MLIEPTYLPTHTHECTGWHGRARTQRYTYKFLTLTFLNFVCAEKLFKSVNASTLFCFFKQCLDLFWISQIFLCLAALRVTKIKITGSVGRQAYTDPRLHTAYIAEC